MLSTGNLAANRTANRGGVFAPAAPIPVGATFYLRWFEKHLPPTGVSVRPCAMEYLGLSVAGPESRAVLQKLVAILTASATTARGRR